MTLNLDKKALNNSIANAMAGLAKDLTAAFDQVNPDLNSQLKRSVAVTNNTCHVEWEAKNKSPSAIQLHEGAVIDGIRINHHPWVTNTLDRFDVGKAFSKHYG